MNIYIQTQGARLIREGRHLLVKKGEDTYHTLFVEKLEQIVGGKMLNMITLLMRIRRTRDRQEPKLAAREIR